MTEETRLIRLPEVLRRLGCSRTTIYKLMRDETFPKPVRYSRALTWKSTDIERWIERQVAA